ncbi:MAG: LLM class flavin-dependent oxidoreductase, partial [Microlunatus sp.]|nr:LLM class flavin-dependent oxidoreductase [Microlunatus sp.]
ETTSSREHAAMLDEALPLLDSFLRGERVDHDGAHYRVHAHLAPAALQEPRPRIWVGTHLSNRRGLDRAMRWDGIAPQDWPGITPEQVAALAATVDRGSAYDVVVRVGHPDSAPVAEFAAAGATWGIAGMLGPEETFDEVRTRVLAGPPR